MPLDATISAGPPAEEKTASPRFWSLHSHTGLQLAGTHLRMIQVPASEFMDKTQNNSRSSLLGIFINILLPVLILDYCSAGPANPLERPAGESFWHIGPVWALVFALSLPLVYGIRSLVVTRKFDLMSGVGMAGVLLTGVISIFVIGAHPQRHSLAVCRKGGPDSPHPGGGGRRLPLHRLPPSQHVHLHAEAV